MSTVARDSVLWLGDPRLRSACAPVEDLADPALRSERERLKAVLEAFRAEHGFGRAVAAPQIGIAKRFIALNLGDGPFVITNPEIVWKDPATFSMWDDCMSFPFLLVRVMRHASVSVRFTGEDGERRVWERLDRATSELLQHEIDHLDGVLALDRAIDRDSIVSRAVFESMPEWFGAQVDYTIAALPARAASARELR